MVLTLKLTLIFGLQKLQDAANVLLIVIWQHLMPKYMRKLLSLCKSNGKSRDIKISQICVIQNILHVTLIAKTLTGYRPMLTFILVKSLTVDPCNCWPLNVRMSVIPISSGQWFWNRIHFRTENGFFIVIISFTKAIFGSKMNSVPKSLTRWNGYYAQSILC